MKDENIPSEVIDSAILALARLDKNPTARLFALAIIEAREEGVSWGALHLAIVKAQETAEKAPEG